MYLEPSSKTYEMFFSKHVESPWHARSSGPFRYRSYVLIDFFRVITFYCFRL